MRRLIIACTLALLVATSSAILPTRAATGDPDRSFGGYGTGGRTLSEPFPGASIAASVATPDEQLIVVGSDGQDIVVVRYDASGKLDPAFGSNGVTRLDFDNQTDSASAVAITYNAEKILVAGTTTFGLPDAPNADFAMALLNADGQPDAGFSLDGKTTLDFNGRADRATAVMALGQDKMLVAGSVVQNPSGNQDFGFALINRAGGLDGSFGTGGRAQHDLGGNETLLTMERSNSNIYAAGYRTIGTTSEYVVSAHNYGSGKLNLSFNGTGYRAGASPSRVTDLLVAGSLEDEAVIVIGNVGGDFGLLGFKQDGSPLTTWGNNGLVTADFGADDTPHTISYLKGDTITVAGASGTRLAMARFTLQGQLVPNTAVTADLADTGGEEIRALAVALVTNVRLWTIGAFKVGDTARLALARHFLAGSADAGGHQTTDFDERLVSGLRNSDDRASAAVFQPDGKIVVAGTSSRSGYERETALARYTSAGALDPTFDGDGRLILEIMPRGATDIALQPDGKIVVAGSSFNVARLNPNGSPDTSFNSTGKAAFAIPNGVSASVIIQPDGKIVVAGYANNPATIVVARFTATGAPDASFGFEGVQRIGIRLSSIAFDVAIQPDGKLIVAGATAAAQTDTDFALVRLNANGSLDASFDGDGKLTTEFGSIDAAISVAIQPDGAILAAGVSTNNGAAFARYRPADGALDTSFSGDGKQLIQATGNDWVRSLAISDIGITAAICDENESAGLVLRLAPDGELDTSINGNGRLPFRFGGTDCPFGLAQVTGRVAAVGYARSVPLNTPSGLSEDFAVAIYEVAAPPPPPTATPPVPSATPTVPSPAPDERRVYLPLVQR